jgi:hypothetical protein
VIADVASFQGLGDDVPCTVCSVIPVDGDWLVEYGKTIHGPYLSNGIALRVAVSEAQALHRQGQRSRISVQDNAGAISAEYCLCADFKKARP